MYERHPRSANASPEGLAAYHEEFKRSPSKWRACALVRIEPSGSKYHEVRRCPYCATELSRPLRSLVLQYTDQDSVTVLPLSSTMLSVPIGVPLAELQRDVVEQVYEMVGSVKGTAQLLGVARRTLYRWLPELVLQEEIKQLEVAIPPPRRKRRQ